MAKKCTSHMEDYLERILTLEKVHGHAHVKEIAKKMKIKMPSVTEALRKLKKAGMVSYERYSTVTLTKKGKAMAKDVFQRHKVLYKFLHGILGVEKGIAEEDACRMEHVINPKTFRKLIKFIDSQR